MPKGPKPKHTGRKNCKRCGAWRPVSDFTPQKWGDNGLIRWIYPYCPECVRKQQARKYRGLTDEQRAARRVRNAEYQRQRRRRLGITPRFAKPQSVHYWEGPARKEIKPVKPKKTPDLSRVSNNSREAIIKHKNDYIREGALIYARRPEGWLQAILTTQGADYECKHGRLPGDRLDGLAPNWPHTYPCGCYPSEAAPPVD